MGAGAIGCFLGLHAARGGARVTLIGRAELSRQGDALSVHRLDGQVLRCSPSVTLSDDASALSNADIVLITVKSRDSAAVGEHLATLLPAQTPLVSFQNGLENLHRLGRSLGPRVIAGMVSFNVVRDHAVLRQASTGPLVAGLGTPEQRPLLLQLAAALGAGGLPLELHENIVDIVAGKLLLNLSNGIGAACGLPIVATLRSRDARWCFSRCLHEGIHALQRAGYRPHNVIGLPPRAIAALLRLPNMIVLRVAERLVKLDPNARSSTLQDLDAGKPTEIGDLNGAIAELAASHGLQAPANQTITAVVRDLEGAPRPLPFVPPKQLRERIVAASRAQ